ncbi:hypothetical protein Tco_1110935 [Tanacetum coccineum]|uniref:Uncharacterized protein n=1 Tax=Tanacetum coccineum TaxID=301880 RepID=A0ABQ5IK99_9ASTR
MNNFADFPKSELLYGQEAQTQMINFTDLPKSDSGYDQKQVKNERLVENVKRGKRVRKRGKGAKKDLACDFERVTVCDCDKRGDRVRVAYLKDEIEALRPRFKIPASVFIRSQKSLNAVIEPEKLKSTVRHVRQ